MTQEVVDRRLTGRNKLENHKDDVIAALVAGDSWSMVEQRFACSRAALGKFHERHSQEIDALRAKVAERTQDVILTTSEGRIRELAKWYDRLESEASEYGVTVVEERQEPERNGGAMVVTRDFRGQLVKEARGIIDDIARELGERSNKGGDTYNIDRAILVRYIEGPEG